MKNITISGIKDTEDFKTKKSQAWGYIKGRCNFCIDDFEPAQYKYFDKLLQLYGKLDNGNITKRQAEEEDEKNYEELEKYVDERLVYIQDRIAIAENIKSTYADIARIEKSHNMAEMFGFMADALGKLLDDASFAQRQKAKLEVTSDT